MGFEIRPTLHKVLEQLSATVDCSIRRTPESHSDVIDVTFSQLRKQNSRQMSFREWITASLKRLKWRTTVDLRNWARPGHKIMDWELDWQLPNRRKTSSDSEAMNPFHRSPGTQTLRVDGISNRIQMASTQMNRTRKGRIDRVLQELRQHDLLFLPSTEKHMCWFGTEFHEKMSKRFTCACCFD
jgi:hypothetical protein